VRAMRKAWLLSGTAVLLLACATRGEPTARRADSVQVASGVVVEPSVDRSTDKVAPDSEVVSASDAPELAKSPAADLSKDPAPAKDSRPRIAALGPHTWIWKKPERKGLAIGKMRIGTSIALRQAAPVDGTGCSGKWYAIEPYGYVCDDPAATLDLDDPYFKALQFSAPADGTWPYRYAHSNGSPMYSRVPTEEEWKKAERDYGPAGVWKTLGDWAKGHEELVTHEPIRATDPVPYFLEGGKRTAPGGNYNTQVLVWRRIPAGSMLAYSRAFEANGRVWLLTPDTMIVPADRVSQLRRSTFRGIHFDETDLRLPFAWNRAKKPIALYQRDASGAFVKTERTLAPKTPVEIHDRKIEQSGWVYFELRREPGVFVGKTADPAKQLDVELTISRAATELPSTVKPDEKWIDVRILSGTLTAYEGLRPVMSTLFSPGKGGPPRPDFKFPEDHTNYATTSVGRFPIEWKERVATMSSEKGEPKVLWFTDVPNQQYLKAPLAMHVSYWHEDFGKRKSAECVNVSPIDGEWLFGWTLPRLPEGWNAMGPHSGAELPTPIHVSAQ
jgi:hypothetical protein